MGSESDDSEALCVCLDGEGRVEGSGGYASAGLRVFERLLSLRPSALASLRSDCLLASWPLAKGSFWVGHGQTPRSGMEDLALRILAMHTGKLPHALLAGAEWWANVSRSDTMDRVDGYGDIGFHFDKDEAIYGTHGLIIHPLLSTVTYLSDDGAPTVVLPRGRITPTGEYMVDKLPEAIVVPPRVGRHVCFDGRWTILACPTSSS